MPCYFCLQQQQPWRPAMVPGRAKDWPTWRHRHCFPPRPTLRCRAKSPKRVKALTPILALRAMDHWVRRGGGKSGCRMFQIVARHLLSSSSSRMSGCVRRETCDSRQRGFLLTGPAGAKSLHNLWSHEIEREGGRVTLQWSQETTGLGRRHNNISRAQLSIDKGTFR